MPSIDVVQDDQLAEVAADLGVDAIDGLELLSHDAAALLSGAKGFSKFALSDKLAQLLRHHPPSVVTSDPVVQKSDFAGHAATEFVT